MPCLLLGRIPTVAEDQPRTTHLNRIAMTEILSCSSLTVDPSGSARRKVVDLKTFIFPINDSLARVGAPILQANLVVVAPADIDCRPRLQRISPGSPLDLEPCIGKKELRVSLRTGYVKLKKAVKILEEDVPTFLDVLKKEYPNIRFEISDDAEE